MRGYFFILLFAFGMNNWIQSQDLEKMLDDATGPQTNYTEATFKSTRIINGHSIERMKAKQLDFRISHRFGQINSGIYDYFGLDNAYIHLSFEYGVTDWLMLSVGRGNYEKTYDGFAKISVLRQSKGDRNMPISLSYFTSMAINTLRWTIPGTTLNFWDRTSYVHQILVARKFNEWFSLEINPTYVHRNMVATELDPNDLFSMGIGGRLKITKRLTFNAEYYYVLPPMNDYRSQKTYNALSVGVDIETGGHVFQLFLSNSEAMIEKGFIGETTGNWKDGGIHFGFNVSRVFAF